MDYVILFIGVFGSIASIIAIFFDFYRNSRSKREWTLLLLLMFSMILICFSYKEINDFKNVQNEANSIMENWPSKDRLPFSSTGEIRGYALSGYSFLERHKEYFPDSFDLVSKFILEDMTLTKKIEGEITSEESERIREDFLTIAQIVGSIRNKPYR